MDIRVNDNKLELFDAEELGKEEVEFLLTLLNTGEYWELRKHGENYTLHDKDNSKYKGSLEQIKSELDGIA